jgi:hypothetical protein
MMKNCFLIKTTIYYKIKMIKKSSKLSMPGTLSCTYIPWKTDKIISLLYCTLNFIELTEDQGWGSIGGVWFGLCDLEIFKLKTTRTLFPGKMFCCGISFQAVTIRIFGKVS